MIIRFYTGMRIYQNGSFMPEIGEAVLHKMRRAEDHLIKENSPLALLRLYVQRYEKAWLEL